MIDFSKVTGLPLSFSIKYTRAKGSLRRLAGAKS